MRGERWNEGDVPDQSGRSVYVTGASSGIGLETAKVLAQRGARVLLGCRNRTKAATAERTIREAAPDADLVTVDLDLADLASVRAGAERVRDIAPRLDVLVNNAGVMAVPLQRT